MTQTQNDAEFELEWLLRQKYHFSIYCYLESVRPVAARQGINARVVLLFLRFCHDFSAPSKLSFQTLSKKPALHVFATISGKPSVRSPAGRRNRSDSARRDEERRFPAALMARDEARHGKAFEGLLNRYFGK